MTRVDVLFIHHSVGRGILRHGTVRKHLASLANDVVVHLWDHDYNRRGLHDANGRRLRRSFPIPDDNTYPDGLLKLFTKGVADPVLGDQLRRFPIVIMKSCFPNSRIKSAEEFERFQEVYAAIAQNAMALGVMPCIATTPPVRVGRISPEEARRAGEMAEWLTREGPFSHTFDLFSMLAETDKTSSAYGTLARENANVVPIDSHPKIRASRRVGPAFARFIQDVAASSVAMPAST
jgi:hypothetical protein